MIDHLKGRDKALEPFGLTGRRAEWIALASLHGGVFTRSLSAWLGIDRFKTFRFVQALTRRRLAAEEMVGDLKACRICARGIYRALGAEGFRTRRITSTGVAMRRLLSFDYVIEHTGLPWLPTEAEKVAAFEALDIGRYGRLRDCLTRLAELRAALPTAPSEAMIDRFTVWRSSRFSEGGI